MADIQAWENGILGQHLNTDGVKNDAGQCSQVPISWAEVLFPGVPWSKLLPLANGNGGVDTWAGRSTDYMTWIENNTSDKNQLPMVGDIIVIGATPAKGYTSTFKNPQGHTGVVKSASVSGYTLIQQNSPALGSGVNDTSYPWNHFPVLGWFRPKNQVVNAPNPAPAPAQIPVMSNNVSKILTLPGNITSWHVYNPAGPYNLAHATHVLNPSLGGPGGLHYAILADLGNGIYKIHTEDYGDVAIWTQGTPASITDAAPAPAPTPQTKPITVQSGWGLEKIAQAAGIANPNVPATWSKIAAANGSGDWQAYNRGLKVGQVVQVPLS